MPANVQVDEFGPNASHTLQQRSLESRASER